MNRIETHERFVYFYASSTNVVSCLAARAETEMVALPFSCPVEEVADKIFDYELAR